MNVNQALRKIYTHFERFLYQTKNKRAKKKARIRKRFLLKFKKRNSATK